MRQAAGPDILPVLPMVVDLAHQAFPLLALGLDLSSTVLQDAALASVAAAFAIVTVVPDDTVVRSAGRRVGYASRSLSFPYH